MGPANEAAYALIEAWPDWPDSVLVLTGPSRQRQESSRGDLGGARPCLDDPGRRGRGRRGPAPRLERRAGDRGYRSGGAAGRGGPVPSAQPRAGARLPGAADERHGNRRPRPCHAGSAITAAPRPRIAIDAPDDALLRAVLVKLFVDRQLVVDLGVIDSLALRIDRSLGRARDVVAELDRDALGRGRRISRPLALAVLRRMGFDDEADAGG